MTPRIIHSRDTSAVILIGTPWVRIYVPLQGGILLVVEPALSPLS